MGKLDDISDRVLERAERVGEKLRLGETAGRLLQTGVALGVARTGAKVAIRVVRRNPVVAVAVGVGLLALAAYRRRKRAQMQGSTEGTPRRIDARRVDGTGKPPIAESQLREGAIGSPSPET